MSESGSTALAAASAGLGLRRGLMDVFRGFSDDAIDFMEVAPENWIRIGGRFGRAFEALVERFPLVAHGLSLSIGGPAPLDEGLLRDTRRFLDTYDVALYSEHLSFTTDTHQLYDLLPIPFTEEAAAFAAARVRAVQDRLGRRMAIENVSYYAAPGAEMAEVEFVARVVREADCDLLLDVNNVYVNSINHGYDPVAFIDRLAVAVPSERLAYYHIAGHYDEADDLKVDTHGADVIEPVWALLGHAYERFGVRPTLLERDFNFPSARQLLAEVDSVREHLRRHSYASTHSTG